jgi:hypothetical protein
MTVRMLQVSLDTASDECVVSNTEQAVNSINSYNHYVYI